MFKSIKLLAATLALSTSLIAPAMAADAVKVGMSGRYYPFTFVQQDKLQGFEVDVWNAIGERLDREVEFATFGRCSYRSLK